MRSCGWLGPLYLGLAVAVSAAPSAGNETPDPESANGILPKFPIHPPRFPIPPPGFGGLTDSPAPELGQRAAAVAMCGPNLGSCEDSYCCSPSGYCGNSKHYCQAPGCQIDYGNGCDALKMPWGDSTLDIPRDHIGDVPYALNPIYHCKVPNTVALTYDDGPNIYTSDLLDILDSFGAKATFFVSGINSNKGSIDDPDLPWMDLIDRMINSNHQIASHTWGHQNLKDLSYDKRRGQMERLEMALRNIFGGFPTYMRPPYSSCSVKSGCIHDMDELGYHVAYFDVDTDDYNNDSPELIQNSKDRFDNAMAAAEPYGKPLLVIAHDIHEQTVYNLTSHMLHRLYAADYQAVTLGECLGDDPEFWYRWDYRNTYPQQRFPNRFINSSKSVHPKKRKPSSVSLDGSCGKKKTCLGSTFGNCCSSMGYCGNSTSYCGIGCQTAYGECFNSTLAH
ncbi:hypothetical protein AJ79_09550 [Helicocarpus griseus UAMH5409]|uniref:Chitin deacetylase n=1 Tax=Helicocarpus griseus UAMH5409 TaxID=1447875 RepID=A0A2B7WIS1_9EURO|nr:hypothetical protein AJ79_09550 [Helicocarpus griseus UAMH5409]